MKINLQKKILFLGLPILVILLALFLLQGPIFKVSANVVPVTVSMEHLDFGNVFPGEELEGIFVVTYVDAEDGVIYKIIQKRKPLPEEHPDYPDGGDPEMPGYYLNLCPFLEKVSDEGEGDTESSAFVGPGDTSDTWVIYFKVPAIFGNIGQNHIGGVIDESGEYGCDISIDIEGCTEVEICDNQIDDNCDGYTDCDDEGCLQHPFCQPG